MKSNPTNEETLLAVAASFVSKLDNEALRRLITISRPIKRKLNSLDDGMEFPVLLILLYEFFVRREMQRIKKERR